MGQASSRSRPSPSPPLPDQPSSSPRPEPPPLEQTRERTQSSATAVSASSKGSPRSSFRRSVRALLPRPRSIDHSPSDNPSHSLRKRWRSSKRFSKHQHPLSDPPEAPADRTLPTSISLHPDPTLEHASAIDSLSAAPITSPTSSPSALLPSTTSLPVPSDSAVLPLSSALSPQPFEVSSSQYSPQNVPFVLDSGLKQASDIQGQTLSTHHTDTELDFVEGSSRDGPTPPPLSSFSTASPQDPLSCPTHPELESVPEPQPQRQPPRHFQPPGPLVVVQGVVNTSDNPAMSQSASSSRSPGSLMPHYRSRTVSHSEDRHSARNRLSALIPRPNSMLARRPSTPDDSPPAHESDSSFDSPGTSQDPTSSVTSLSEDDPSSHAAGAEHTVSHDGDVRPRPLSPGSIDVLGTLLSVAAAATAASLFSPSLGYQANAETNGPPPSSIPRPMSPTPTAGLGGGEGFGSLPGFGIEPPVTMGQQSTPFSQAQPREGRERIRGVWDNFRDRLGLNRGAQSSNAPDDNSNSGGEQGNMRPGEVMLAEMARALNIGLGLNGDGTSTQAQSPDATVDSTSNDAPPSSDNASAGRPVPPEDSFERFLLNLQADLRVVLSDDNTSSDQPSAPAHHHDEDESPIGEEAASSRLPLFNELPMRVTEQDEDEMPALEDVSDSEDEVNDAYEETVSSRTPTPMPASSTVPPNRVDQSSARAIAREQDGSADRGPPGINLWRLYRFQPIPASQVSGHAPATTSPPVSLSPSVPTSPSPHAADSSSTPLPPTTGPTLSSTSPSAATLSVPQESNTDTTGGAQTAGDASLSIVIPVIVVGLQSVEMGQAHGHAHPPDSESLASDTDRRRPSSTSFDESQRTDASYENEGLGTASTRGRGGWQSRAATALRNLRPGRRNGSRGRRAAEGSGSRTFLIYVIGGYYPPNHHMVTGPDNLDSYEALWELAELLGQVKPPVATREDIDNSGLRVIKRSDLEQFEKDGKVASNSVERCLICLDDYADEDELRLMTCKHAFHKDCVDKWLQVGRNNCPACRSKGVSTAGDFAH